MADSDSDGLTDKQEVESGKNPNCAEGKDCNISVADNASAVPTDTTTLANANDIFNADSYDVTSTLESMMTSPDQMRQVLLDSGLSQSVVDKISDEDLTKMAAEILTSSTLLDDMSSATSTPDVTSTAQFINKIMGAQ